MFIPVSCVSELQHFKSFDSGQAGGWTTDDRVLRNDKWRSGYTRAWRRGVEDLPQVMRFPAKTKWRHAELNPFSALCSSDDLRTILRHMGMYDKGTTRGIRGADSGHGQGRLTTVLLAWNVWHGDIQRDQRRGQWPSRGIRGADSGHGQGRLTTALLAWNVWQGDIQRDQRRGQWPWPGMLNYSAACVQSETIRNDSLEKQSSLRPQPKQCSLSWTFRGRKN